LTERLAEAEWEAVSVTWTVKGKEPAEVGLPEMVPAELTVRPAGREPLASDQAQGVVRPEAESVATLLVEWNPRGSRRVVICSVEVPPEPEPELSTTAITS